MTNNSHELRLTLEVEQTPRKRSIVIAQNDDPELLEWLAKASQEGGGFISSIARAGLVADEENYPAIRPFLLLMRARYPKYEPSDAVKQEIRDREKAHT